MLTIDDLLFIERIDLLGSSNANDLSRAISLLDIIISKSDTKQIFAHPSLFVHYHKKLVLNKGIGLKSTSEENFKLLQDSCLEISRSLIKQWPKVQSGEQSQVASLQKKVDELQQELSTLKDTIICSDILNEAMLAEERDKSAQLALRLGQAEQTITEMLKNDPLYKNLLNDEEITPPAKRHCP